MQQKALSQDFWNNLYQTNDTGWNIGYPSPPIKAYVDQLRKKDLPILIPGCGNAYEAEYLLEQGFTNVTVIDIASSLTAALENKFKKEVGKSINIITGDFFEHSGKYHLILEQTFFCALHPSLRMKYADKMHSLLAKGGHLAGVLFNKVFEEEGPPFGGSMEEYKLLFKKKFEIKTLEPCYNSIEKRKGNEVFINLVSK